MRLDHGTHNRGSLDSNSSYIVLYGVPKEYILGLSMEGPGRRTADPVPAETTLKPAALGKELSILARRDGMELTGADYGLP